MADIMETISFLDITEGIDFVDAAFQSLILKALIPYMKCV
jgi:hypothetical protein